MKLNVEKGVSRSVYVAPRVSASSAILKEDIASSKRNEKTTKTTRLGG